MKCPDECFNGEGGFPGMCQVCESVFTIEKRISEILLLSENRKQVVASSNISILFSCTATAW